MKLPAHRELWRIRNRLGLTQAEFADKLGISRNQVSRIELGNSGASESLMRLARLLGREGVTQK